MLPRWLLLTYRKWFLEISVAEWENKKKKSKNNQKCITIDWNLYTIRQPIRFLKESVRKHLADVIRNRLQITESASLRGQGVCFSAVQAWESKLLFETCHDLPDYLAKSQLQRYQACSKFLMTTRRTRSKLVTKMFNRE